MPPRPEGGLPEQSEVAGYEAISAPNQRVFSAAQTCPAGHVHYLLHLWPDSHIQRHALHRHRPGPLHHNTAHRHHPRYRRLRCNDGHRPGYLRRAPGSGSMPSAPCSSWRCSCSAPAARRPATTAGSASAPIGLQPTEFIKLAFIVALGKHLIYLKNPA